MTSRQEDGGQEQELGWRRLNRNMLEDKSDEQENDMRMVLWSDHVSEG